MKELQRHYGWLTDEAVGEAAELLGLSPLQVEELATFYEMIYRQPVGKRVLHVCDSISCWSTGYETIMTMSGNGSASLRGRPPRTACLPSFPAAASAIAAKGPR